MEKKVWKVAVIGCGMFANSQYLPNITKEANAVCVAAVDIVKERADKACRDYNIPNSYETVYELIEKCDFDIANAYRVRDTLFRRHSYKDGIFARVFSIPLFSARA